MTAKPEAALKDSPIATKANQQWIQKADQVHYSAFDVTGHYRSQIKQKINKIDCRSKPEDVLVSTLVPLYVWFKLSEEYFVFPAFSFTLSPNLSDILDR